MEKQVSGKGVQINTGRIPILLALRRVNDLKPHEEIVEPDLHGIIRALESDPVLRHPIIADTNSGAVLDGTHRLAALSRLGCVTIPTALIDYQNHLVEIDRWFRTITEGNLSSFIHDIEKLSPVPMPASDANRNVLSRKSYATLCNELDCYAFAATSTSPLEMCRGAFKLEQKARERQMKIVYSDNSETKIAPGLGFTMSTIRLEKDEVVASSLNHSLFPPKSTRHLIPSRPLGIGFPLDWLKDTNVARAEMEFERHLRSMKVKRLPEGSWVGSRRYMEEVFLFE